MDNSAEASDVEVLADEEEAETGTTGVLEDDVEGAADVDSQVADEDRSHATTLGPDDDDNEEEEGSKSMMTPADDASQISIPASASGTTATGEGDGTTTTPAKNSKKRSQPQIPAGARKGRSPAVKGLTIPFRTVKKAMKLDPDIPIVQNEAAIMTTMAAELFLKSLAKESLKISKARGRNTVRYDDIAEARSNDKTLAFLKTILP